MVNYLPVLGPVLGLIQMVINLTMDGRKLRGKLNGILWHIKFELEMIQGDIEKYEDLKLQELAYDIEEYIYGLSPPGPFASFFLAGTGFDPRPEDIARMESFLKSIDSLQKRLPQSSESKQSEGSGSPSYAPEKDLVGIAKPKEELLKLLSRGDGQLRVISIVGCIGLGKTALARALYDDPAVAKEFDRTWIVASERSPADILNKILQQVDLSAANNRRYLVFIDDVQQPGLPWKDIKNAFRENNMDSRIIVTTSVHSVAAACSAGSYVYTMQYLDKVKSKELFWGKVCGHPTAPTDALDDGSKSIIDKCDGLPLALISTGKYLGGKWPDPTKESCEDVGKELGNCLAGNESAFEEMKRALIQCYNNLPDHGHRGCLLYVSIFPKGHQVNRKSLIRRLIAEGLVPVDGRIMRAQESVVRDVRNCLDKLIDQSIIELVPVPNNSKVSRRCKVHSIMLEFTIKKAVSKNFSSLIHKDEPLHNTDGSVRRLSVQSSPNVGCIGLLKEIGLSGLRSLTIFNSGVVNFKSCKMMRVLDLGGCSGLNSAVLDDICGLLLLKYLSLKNTNVDELPKKMEKLQRLETLDIRETKVEVLSVEVVMLPQLAYLFGKFKLRPLTDEEIEKLTEFLKNESKLHTLAGIVIDKTKGFETVITHAKVLKKVKVWCEDTRTAAPAPAPSSNPATATPSSTTARTPALNRKFRFLDCFGFSGEPAGNPASNATPGSIPKRVVANGKAPKFANGKAPKFQTYNPEPPNPNTSIPAPPPPNSSLEASRLADTLVSALEKRFVGLQSLSIDFKGIRNDFLDSLNANCTISSMKLRGGLGSLPESDKLRDLRNLNKLHLFSTGLSSKQMEALQNLVCLEYLNLTEDCAEAWDGDFVVRGDGFPSIKELCFESPNKHPRVQIAQGAMSRLASLQLLCPHPPLEESGLGVEGISHLANLNEVIRHSSATEDNMKAWEKAANGNRNRPYVKKQPAQPISNTA